MAYNITIKKLETAEIPVSSTINLPVILVTFEDGWTCDTWGNWYDFLDEVFLPMIQGIDTTIGLGFNSYQHPNLISPVLNDGFVSGTVNFGSSSSFHFTRQVSAYSGNIQGVRPNPDVLIDTKRVGLFNAAGNDDTGTHLKISPWVFVLDASDNIYEWVSGTYQCFCYLTDEWNDLSIKDSCMPVMGSGNVYKAQRQNSESLAFENFLATVLPANDTFTNRRSVDEDEDPYSGGGYSGPDAGDVGTFDYEGTPQPFGQAPAFKDGLDTGFYTLYAPSPTELQNLATYLWSTNFDLNLFKRLFNNPMDLFLVLGMLPVTIPKGSQKEVGIGLITTGVYMTTAAARVVPVNMGTIQVKGKTAGYLDYAPYTRCDLILPFVGVVPIDVDAIMDKYVNVYYNIDVLTGSCVAGISAGHTTDKMHVIGTYAGNCMRSIPLTGADYTNMLSGLVQTAGAIAAGAASGGAAGAIAGGLAASSSAVVNEGKPMIQKGGALSSAAGFLLGENQMRPVLIFSYPQQCLPSSQISEIGFPSYTSGLLGDYSGFVRVEEIHLRGITLTDEELNELESILKEGVYV